MSFGKNPYVAKAQAAEQKAQAASDEAARVLAHREAAREWDRASAREQGKRRDEYAAKASEQRALADGQADEATEVAPDPRTMN